MSAPLTIGPDKRSFQRGGAPFFWLADTVWSAFSEITLPEWQGYLALRKSQGFNVLQINALTQWDGGQSPVTGTPYAVGEDGRVDYTRPNPAYFDRAAEMLAMAVDEGFVPAVVLLWCGTVPDTWLSRRQGGAAVIPLGLLPAVVEHLVDCFAPFGPVWMVSGDTDFSPESIPYYREALATVRRRTPHLPATLHMNGGNVGIPPELLSDGIDFYMYQSSHDRAELANTHRLAARMHAYPAAPVLNGEPPYEGHGNVSVLGRYTAAEVRRAGWQSLLSGAGAGITYGAHGVWGWNRHRDGIAPEFSGKPVPAALALNFAGAWDYGFMRHIVEQHDLFGLVPCREHLRLPQSEEVCIARSGDGARMAVYLPCQADLRLEGVTPPARITAWDLTERRPLFVESARDGDSLVIDMPYANTDLLYVLEWGE